MAAGPSAAIAALAKASIADEAKRQVTPFWGIGE
jgi:hypothetical protein